MNSANEAIAYSLATSQALLKRFVADLSAEDYLHRPTPKANCAAWIVGHVALSDRNVLKRLEAPLPELPEGFERRFSRAEGCPEAEEFGDVSGLVKIFEEHRNRLIAASRSAPPEQLNKPMERPHPMFKTVGEMVNFMALHSTMHAGQISTIRRSLGRPPLI